MTADEIECIEGGAIEPTIALPRRLAAALDAEVRLTAGHDLGSLCFEPHAALALREGTRRHTHAVSGRCTPVCYALTCMRRA
jgi:hypothetical protein